MPNTPTKHQPILLNSITDADQTAANQIVVCGSHGGLYPASLAAAARVRAVLFNDAGIGLENAGIAGILALAEIGMAAAGVSHKSCRIGDADDMMVRGTISAVNGIAKELGVKAGDSVSRAVEFFDASAKPTGTFDTMDEARRELHNESTLTKLILVDSASLVRFQDGGCIVITGSHGGLIGSDPARALKTDAALAVFNDAGGGRDNAGLSRLPALDQRGIAAATVSHDTARIGDATSSFNTGVISNANSAAATAGIAVGLPLKLAVSRFQIV